MDNELNILGTEEDTSEELAVDQAPVDNSSPFEKAIKVELNDDEKTELFKEIELEMSEINKEYDDAKYFERVQQAEDDYLLKKTYTDYPIPDGSNRKIAWLLMFTDILTGKAKRMTTEPRPMFIMETSKYGAQIDLEAKSKNEERLDFIMRKDVKMDQLLQQVYPRSYYQGTAIVKVPLKHQPNYHTTNKQYTKDNEAEYMKQAGDGIYNPETEQYKNWESLKGGATLESVVDVPTSVDHGARPYRVPLDRFFARLSIIDFNDAKLISEQMDLTWNQISNNFETGFYDPAELEEYKEKHPEYTDEKNCDVYEGIFRSDFKSKGKIRKYHVVYDSVSKQVLRCVYYEYDHNRCNYIPVSARPRDDQWLGYMANERMEDTLSAANAFLNSSINEFNIAHMKTVVTDSQLDFSRQEVTDTNINVLRMEKGATLHEIKFDYAPSDRINFISVLQTFAELTEGISASIASGGETPQDPRAPAAKSAMKLQQSTMRMEDLIVNMQYPINEIAYQVAAITDQFPEEQQENDGTISAELIKDNIMYVCHGSKMAFDKTEDLRTTMGIYEFFKANYPELLQDPEIRKIMFECVINNTEGSITQYKDILIRPLDLVVKAKQEALARTKALEERARAAGIDPAQVMANMGKPPQNPVQGQGMAPQGAPAPVQAPVQGGGI